VTVYEWYVHVVHTRITFLHYRDRVSSRRCMKSLSKMRKRETVRKDKTTLSDLFLFDAAAQFSKKVEARLRAFRYWTLSIKSDSLSIWNSFDFLVTLDLSALLALFARILAFFFLSLQHSNIKCLSRFKCNNFWWFQATRTDLFHSHCYIEFADEIFVIHHAVIHELTELSSSKLWFCASKMNGAILVNTLRRLIEKNRDIVVNGMNKQIVIIFRSHGYTFHVYFACFMISLGTGIIATETARGQRMYKQSYWGRRLSYYGQTPANTSVDCSVCLSLNHIYAPCTVLFVRRIVT